MRIFRGRLALLGPAGLLAACVSLGGSGDGGADAPREVQVTSDAITITGPAGFCVDPTSTRNDGDTGFVLLGNCAVISGQTRAPQPDVAAVLTATVSAPSADGGSNLTANRDLLDPFFRSEDGRRLLSRTGDASSVTILETRISEGMFLLHARDTSTGAVAGVAQDYWRAYIDIGARLATLSVLALEDRGVTDAQALQTLTAFSGAVMAANAAPSAAANAAELPQANAQGGGGLFRNGLFQRIFQ